MSASVLKKSRNSEIYFNNIEWRKIVLMTIKCVRRMEYEEDVSSTIVEDANCVLLELEERLEEHFIKIHSESKKNLWAFQ